METTQSIVRANHDKIRMFGYEGQQENNVGQSNIDVGRKYKTKNTLQLVFFFILDGICKTNCKLHELLGVKERRNKCALDRGESCLAGNHPIILVSLTHHVDSNTSDWKQKMLRNTLNKCQTEETALYNNFLIPVFYNRAVL